ncbi:hypothetical protein FXF51_06150 [Nonomuraea sp. PA05]|uniref:phage tail tube protein n=1 Tax=Nonomuraea sp. PA05 TaxID=2604466 RepID=UPI0011D4F479|nr:hypothetical protein [Nonomuraea sp. PA05]TYB69742.1 hypothetical protein FXF51_06150 [Nonomuraea sp. PA05]
MAGADLLGDGNVKVTFCLTIANVNAPTAAELNAGVDLQEFITKDGLGISPEQAAVDNTALASRDETEDAGTVKYSIELTVKRKEIAAEDIGWNTLVDRQLGYLAVRRNMAHETAWAADQKGEVYPVRCGRPNMQPPELNAAQRFVSKLFNHTAADADVTVAA